MEELYAVKDKNTGKFVTTLTNPNKKYWDRKVARDKAMQSPSHNWRAGFKGDKEDLIPIDFVLIEKQDYTQNQNTKAVEVLKKARDLIWDLNIGDYYLQNGGTFENIKVKRADVCKIIDQLIDELKRSDILYIIIG